MVGVSWPVVAGIRGALPKSNPASEVSDVLNAIDTKFGFGDLIGSENSIQEILVAGDFPTL
jgi:hypothetical protein